MVKRCVAGLEKGVDSLIREKVRGDYSKISPLLISQVAKEGDEFARLILQETGKYLGVGVGSIINILNPDVVVIGGGVAGAGEILFKSVRRFAQLYSLPSAYSSVKILPARLGDDAGVVGAVCLVFDQER